MPILWYHWVAFPGGMSAIRRYSVVPSMKDNRISSPLTSKERTWGFTCPKCYFVPSITQDDDYIRARFGKFINLRFPKRCKSCEASKKRAMRLQRSISRVFAMSAGIGSFYPTYNYPKLITFALLHDYYSSGDPSEDRRELITRLNKKLPGAIKLLKSRGTLGGTFVLECSSRLIWSDLACEPQMWRHHPHVHMVAVSNFVHHKKLGDYCAMLLPMELGRINLKAPKSSKPVARYIGKYLSKDGFRARTFGIMRSVPKWEKQCFCKHDDMSVIDDKCECLI